MSRRTHRKSRKGCLRCKKKHIKCDETRPRCLRCVTGEAECSFLDAESYMLTPASFSSASSVLEPTFSSTPESTSESFSTKESEVHGALNLTHLELFHHMATHPSMGWHCHTEASQGNELSNAIIKVALATPYLMHQLLALSSLHLAIECPAREGFYARQATELQTTALSLFNATPINVPTAENFLPPFLFSSLLGSHLLHDAISSLTHDSTLDFGGFLKKFVSYLRLARGIRMQLGTASNWSSLKETAFRSMIAAGELIPSSEKATAPELEGLDRRLETADIGPSSLDAYRQAMAHLRAVFQAQRATDKAAGVTAVFAWPVLVSPEFTELLAQRRPEGLVILAHYAVLLHWNRDAWVLGGGGKALIEGVGRFLGECWEEWLSWPAEMVGLSR